MHGHEGHQHPAMADSIQGKYWLYNWIDDQGIRNVKDFRKAIRKRDLVDVLGEYSAATTISSETPPRAVVAARNVDLSGQMTCCHHECLIKQVKSLFGRTWHYFDTLVVDGPLLEDLQRQRDSSFFMDTLENRVRLLLYLRDVGAEEHVAFVRKVEGYCSQHFRQYAIQEDLGLEVLLDEDFEEEVVRKMYRESSFDIGWRDSEGWTYSLQYGDLGNVINILPHSDPSKPPGKKEVIRDAFGRYCAALISDVSAARNLQLPLLQPAATSLLEYSRPHSDPAEAVVALELRLPVLTNIPLKDVLRLRQKHAAEFECFRSALQVAMKEQLAKTGDESPDVIARNVVEEYITPELLRIESELKIDRRALAKKIGANVTVAGAAVTVGTLATIPLVIASGVAAIIPAFGPINQYFADIANIERSPLYFLWRARVSHATGRR